MRRRRNHFSATKRAVAKKTDNNPSATAAKIEIRRKVLEVIGAGEARVFDAYAGAGEMFRGVWKDAAAYTGCDFTWYRDEREAFVADNRLVLRSIDLAAFNVFDLDAWGSPWEQALIIAARRTVGAGEKVGLILTDGGGFDLRFGNVSTALRQLTGLGGRMSCANRHHDEVIEIALQGLCDRMGAGISRMWRATAKRHGGMRYLGLILEGVKK